MRPLIVMLVLLLFPSLSSAADIYVAQNVVGGDTGAGCANAHSSAWFNTAANWGPGGSQIGPGTTVHLCGTFTGTAGSTMLTVQGSGSAGNPITLLFEAGATFSAPYWGTVFVGTDAGAINVKDVSYFVVDGGSNGLIQNTANGTNLANHNASSGLVVGGTTGTTGVEVKNLTIQNIYVQDPNTPSDMQGQYTTGIRVNGSNTNLKIHNNSITGARAGIWASVTGGGTWSNVNIYNNTLRDNCWSMAVGSDTNSTASNVNVYGNDYSNWDNWNKNVNYYHTDGIIVVGVALPTPLFPINIYNNYGHGNLGIGVGAGLVYCTTNTSCTIFNNVLKADDSAQSSPCIAIYGGNTPQNHYVYNNVCDGANITGAGGRPSAFIIYYDFTNGHATLKNNIFMNWYRVYETWSPSSGGADFTTSLAASDYNIFYNIGSSFMFAGQTSCNQGGPNQGYCTFVQWQALSFDTKGSTGAPKLDATYHPQSGSAAIGLGANLTSVGITALDSDRAGVPRLPSGAWDSGVYKFVGAAPAPPTGLSIR